MRVPDVRHLRKMINGVPVVAAPAEIDITAAGQLRAILSDSAALTGLDHLLPCFSSLAESLAPAPVAAAQHG